jgi:hypothetical protein
MQAKNKQMKTMKNPTINTGNTMGGFQGHYTVWKKKNLIRVTYCIPFIQHSQNDKLILTETRLVVAKGWEGWRGRL